MTHQEILKAERANTYLTKSDHQEGSGASACYAVLSEETGIVRVYLDEGRAGKECSLLNQTEESDETGGPSYYVEAVPFHA